MKYTKDSLKNTWGIVESKDHAEFIIELAENTGFEQRTGLEKAYPCYFCLDEDEIYFFSQKHNASNDGEKQTTIPLPPKDKAERPDFSKLPKHFDCVCNKCGGKCCIGNCDEWPKVGDEVVLRYKFDSKQVMHTGRLLYLSRDHLIIETAKDNDYHCHRCDWLIEKPKSKQDLLIEELHQKLLANNCSDEYLLACDIVQGKIKGLSYNP